MQIKTLLSLLIILILSGCATFGTVKLTNDLSPGMTMPEVKKVLGEPSQTQFVGNKLVWKYNLHQNWKGWIPYYLAFDKESQKLDSWYADETEYYKTQQLWLEQMPKQVNVDAEIYGNIHHDVDIR